MEVTKSYFLFDSAHKLLFAKYTSELKSGFRNATTTMQDVTVEDIIVQFFSPLLTSNEILKFHLKRGYESIENESENGIHIALAEFLNFTLVCLGSAPISKLRKSAETAISYAVKLCGPNFELLHSSTTSERLFRKLLTRMDKNISLPMFVYQALPQVPTNNLLRDINGLLESSCTPKTDYLMMLIAENETNKLFPIIPSTHRRYLSTRDVLFLITLSEIGDFYNSTSIDRKIASYLILLRSEDSSSVVVPHAVFITEIDGGGKLFYISEIGNETTSLALGLMTQIRLLIAFSDSCGSSIPDPEMWTLSSKTISNVSGMATPYSSLERTMKEAFVASRSVKPAIYTLKKWFNEFCLSDDILKMKRIQAFRSFEHVRTKLADWKEPIQATVMDEIGSRDPGNDYARSLIKSSKGIIQWTFIDRKNRVLRTSSPEIQLENAEYFIERVTTAIIKYGNMTVFGREKSNDIKIAYYLWLEDNRGKQWKVIPSKLRKAFYGKRRIHHASSLKLFQDDFYDELLCGLFHRKIHKDVNIFELVCISK